VSDVQLPVTLTDNTGAPFTMRAFARADRAALDAMYDAFVPKRAAQGLPPRTREETKRWLDRILAEGTHMVVDVDGRVCGHVMLMPTDDADTVELANFLHQGIRRRGIGTRANAVALDIAKGAGRRKVWLSVEPSNRAAVRSYEKVGFKRRPGSLWAPEVEMEVEV
jgi:RimJ/RimL family protein N-acetyltransferase